MNLIENTNFIERKIFEEKVKKQLAIKQIKKEEKDYTLKDYSNKKSYMLFIDLDRFQMINYVYGHIEGDNILKEYFEIINDFFSDEYFENKVFISRISGGTIAIFIYNLLFYNLKSFENLKNKINLEIEKKNKEIYKKIKPTEVKQMPVLTCSIGLTVINNEKENKEFKEIFELTDEALYTAKELFRDRLEYRKYGI